MDNCGDFNQKINYERDTLKNYQISSKTKKIPKLKILKNSLTTQNYSTK